MSDVIGISNLVFFLLRGLPGLNAQGALSLTGVHGPALSWVLAGRRWEWMGYIVTRSQTGLCPLIIKVMVIA